MQLQKTFKEEICSGVSVTVTTDVKIAEYQYKLCQNTLFENELNCSSLIVSNWLDKAFVYLIFILLVRILYYLSILHLPELTV